MGRVASVVVVYKGRALLLQRSEKDSFPNRWCTPGGKIENDEQPLDGAIRELREETGIEVQADRDLKYLGEHKGPRFTASVHTYHIYLCAATAMPKVKLEDDFQGYGWFTMAEAIAINVMSLPMLELPSVQEVLISKENPR